MTHTDQFLSLTEVLDVLGLSYAKVKKMVACKALLSVEVGDRRMVPESELNGFMNHLVQCDFARYVA